ncbi:hypothetical protein GQ53DRAFT_764586 [Thozetella sp. PMI_491]|nr:hypothetical protein GQ53DRAFT_764586 [Thozetella sp. PMI_491]
MTTKTTSTTSTTSIWAKNPLRDNFVCASSHSGHGNRRIGRGVSRFCCFVWEAIENAHPSFWFIEEKDIAASYAEKTGSEALGRWTSTLVAATPVCFLGGCLDRHSSDVEGGLCDEDMSEHDLDGHFGQTGDYEETISDQLWESPDVLVEDQESWEQIRRTAFILDIAGAEESQFIPMIWEV